MIDRDLFLFSLYAGGMSPVDICFLRHRCIKEDVIVYERIKCDKIARPVLLDKAKVIIETGTPSQNIYFLYLPVNTILQKRCREECVGYLIMLIIL